MDFEHEFRMPLEIAKRSDATVLIMGPTGTGKSTLAREIHDSGTRQNQPFVTVNLATVHENTLESELFGHEKGAFTGADARRVGRLEMARGGTVFLDEIGELSPRLQARLLEFLQSRTIIPVGGNREIALNVRVIAATHQDLERAVRAGTFREDLFYRLRLLPIRTLPLIERTEDFDSIVHDCLEAVCREAKRSILRLSEDVARRLEAHHWPGNFRELRNVLEYAVLASSDGVIRVEYLPAWFVRGRSDSATATESDDSAQLGVAEFKLSMSYDESIGRFEREFLLRALNRNRWRINRTAAAIGLNKATLIRRIRAYSIHPN